MDFIEINKQLHDLGWDYNENLRCYSNENRYVELADAPYIDIYTWNDGEDGSYLTIEEFILFSKILEKEKEKVNEVLRNEKQRNN